jgi:hypothetical protein
MLPGSSNDPPRFRGSKPGLSRLLIFGGDNRSQAAWKCRPSATVAGSQHLDGWAADLGGSAGNFKKNSEIWVRGVDFGFRSREYREIPDGNPYQIRILHFSKDLNGTLIMIRTRLGLVAMFTWTLALMVQPANAALVYTYSPNPANGDSATATFQIVTGGIEMTVTNTEGNTNTSTNAISQVAISFGSGATVPTALSELSGTLDTFVKKKNVTSLSSSNTVDFKPYTYQKVGGNYDLTGHWAASNPTTHSFLLDALPGGPAQMILAAGSVPQAGNGASQSPFFDGSASFFWAASNLPAKLDSSYITGVTFSFGTGPDLLGPGTTPQTPVPSPAPSTLAMSSILFGIFGAVWASKRLRGMKTFAA